jgi:hypothetical protein
MSGIAQQGHAGGRSHIIEQWDQSHPLRSHSGGSHAANQQLKLSMGFRVHPIVRDDDARGAYFVLPLQVGIDPNADNT